MPERTTTQTLTEAQIERGLRDALGTVGFACYHTHNAMRSDRGFPDLVCLSEDGQLCALECKGPKGRIRPGQAEWIERFRRVPGCVLAAIVGPVATDDWMGYDDALAQIADMTAGGE